MGVECYPSDRGGITAAIARAHITARRQGDELPTILNVDTGGAQVQQAIRPGLRTTHPNLHLGRWSGSKRTGTKHNRDILRCPQDMGAQSHDAHESGLSSGLAKVRGRNRLPIRTSHNGHTPRRA